MNISKLRGKKLNIMKPQTKYAKVPLEVLSHPKLTPIDKLIIAYLYSHSDSGNYILAYTRIAKELNISKKWVIERWKWLKEQKYILEDDQNYYITFGIEDSKLKEIKGEQNTPTHEANIGEESTPKVKLEGVENAPNMVKLIHPLGEENTPTEVNKLYLNGEVATPNEYNKEEKKKIEQGVSPISGSSSSSDSNFKIYNLQDPLMKSVYFGETINQKLLNVYFNSDIKNSISSYLQFEKVWLYTLRYVILKDFNFNNEDERKSTINELNEYFDSTSSIIMRHLPSQIEYCKQEEKAVNLKLQHFKL
jgi:DNA-binding Lrp family transcriptional regulator